MMNQPRFVSLSTFLPTGDLWTRLQRNYTRLEEEKYWPANVYQRQKEAGRWPGDTEGRTLLAWVLLAQATGRAPRYLDGMLARWNEEVNEDGFFGKIHTDGISEQQLSGHGWMLQALAELERWRPGSGAREKAMPIIENLFLPTQGKYADYSIDPSEREAAGEYSGSHLKQVGPWILSTDVGCFAIGMTGLIDACEAFDLDSSLSPLIDEMIARFLEIDLAAIGAQTHATLTACRGLMRWADRAERPELVTEAEERYRLYLQLAWTETYANFNWFGRPQWTEPCAIVDSLMAAMELWRRTGKTDLLEHAQLMWFNALGHGQRTNGGFGCDNCPGADGETDLFFKTEESHWCCTMRGAEGLVRMCQYSVVADGDILRLPFGLPGEYRNGDTHLIVESAYPTGANWTLTNAGACPLQVQLFLPSWIETSDRDTEGWASITLKPGESRSLHGTLIAGTRSSLEATTSLRPEFKDFAVRTSGPLLLAQYGEDWKPIAFDYLRGNMTKDASRKRLLSRA